MLFLTFDRIYDEYMKLKDKLNKIFACNDEVAECHWKMITDFEHPAVFVFEEVCHLWVSVLFKLCMYLLIVLGQKGIERSHVH